MKFDTSEFEEVLFKESRNVFLELIATHKHNDIYVIGYYHCGGWDGIFPIFNTRNNIAEPDFNCMDESDFTRCCDGKWNPADYPLLEDYACTLPESEKIFRALASSIPCAAESAVWQACWDASFSAIESVLVRLDRSGVFNELHQPILYLATYDEGYDQRLESIRRTNSSQRVERVALEFAEAIKIHQRWRDECLNELLDS